MKIITSKGRDDIATVYIGEIRKGKLVEFVESVQPPIPREKKWVLLVSTLFGCPVKCLMCDAGTSYNGKLSKDEIFAQIDYLIKKRFPDGIVPIPKFKIQFARTGEPSFNMSVLDVLDELPERYDVPGILPSVSTIAPIGTEDFFKRLLEIKRNKYSGGHFQLQFSIHTTDEDLRDKLIPIKKWSFAKIGEYGQKFYEDGDRKITLNFALAQDMPVDPQILECYFPQNRFLIKITPVNPTYQAIRNGLFSDRSKDLSLLESNRNNVGTDLQVCPSYFRTVIKDLRSSGYEVIVSIGELEENQIGSNCGQYVREHLNQSPVTSHQSPESYNYWNFKLGGVRWIGD